MYKAAFVFYPQAFIGFNKTQRLERHLFSVGFIGSRFSASHAFTSGPAYRQFLPKSETLHRYQFGVIRIHIHAIGQWITNGMLLDRTNLIIVEGDAFISNEEHCKNFVIFLRRSPVIITRWDSLKMLVVLEFVDHKLITSFLKMRSPLSSKITTDKLWRSVAHNAFDDDCHEFVSSREQLLGSVIEKGI